MDDFLKSLKSKERELIAELEASPLFRQLESLRKTITAFENNGSIVNNNAQLNNAASTSAPQIYDRENFTWKQRVLFVIGKLVNAGVADIITEIQKLEPNEYTKGWLDKRVGVTVSQLKKEEKIGIKRINKKNKYFILVK